MDCLLAQSAFVHYFVLLSWKTNLKAYFTTVHLQIILTHFFHDPQASPSVELSLLNKRTSVSIVMYSLKLLRVWLLYRVGG
jgi:hypothetical protein